MYSANSPPNCVPFLDLVTPHVELEQELTDVFRRALLTAGFIGGPVVEEFETAFAAFCDTSRSVAVSSGTDALRFAIIASGVQPGDAVLTVPHTFIATTEAISQAHALPEFIDIDDQTYNMSPMMLERFLQEKCIRNKVGKLLSRRSGRPVTAVVPVHLYGQMVDMDSILELAGEYGLTVIEDACQAHGAEYFSKKLDRWMKAGSMGRAAAFSFYPGKNLGACGEGGAVTTNDPRLAEKVRMLRDHGQVRKYYHDFEGYNGRLDAIQAGILLAKLPHLHEWNAKRRDKAVEYDRLLAANQAIRVPSEPSWSRSVYHLYVIRTVDLNRMIEHLKAAGIGSGSHYPVPLHMQKAYSSLNYSPEDFPIATRVAAEVLSLPMFPQLTLEQQVRVSEQVLAFTSKLARGTGRIETASPAVVGEMA
jgi:dTDP-4-amino-4,6-dideoxygalactose transaminase